MDIIDRVIFQGHILDVYGTPEEPLFLAVEVARMIDYSVGKTHQMLDNVDDCEKIRLRVLTPIFTRSNISSERKTVSSYKWFLTEDGLYEVLMQSRKPVAKQFKTVVKKILRDLKTLRDNSSESDWFNYLNSVADLQALNDLREDMGLEPLEDEVYFH